MYAVRTKSGRVIGRYATQAEAERACRTAGSPRKSGAHWYWYRVRMFEMLNTDRKGHASGPQITVRYRAKSEKEATARAEAEGGRVIDIEKLGPVIEGSPRRIPMPDMSWLHGGPTGSLHERAAAALGWTVGQTHGMSLAALREMVRGVNPALAEEMSREIQLGRHIVGARRGRSPLLDRNADAATQRRQWAMKVRKMSDAELQRSARYFGPSSGYMGLACRTELKRRGLRAGSPVRGAERTRLLKIHADVSKKLWAKSPMSRGLKDLPPPGARVRLTGIYLKNTGQQRGGEGASVWTVLGSSGRDFVVVNEPADTSYFTPAEMAADPSLRWRRINKANLQIVGAKPKAGDSP